MVAGEQRRVYKSWANIGETDVQLPTDCQLIEGLYISALIGFGGTVRGGAAHTLGAGHGRDHGDVSASLFDHLQEGLVYHPCET